MRQSLIIISTIFVLIVISITIFNKKNLPSSTGPLTKLTVGKQVEYGTLFVIAQQQGYFTQNGLDVTLKEYASGPPAVTDLLAGKIDMTDAAEFVGVRNSFSNEDIKIISSIGTAADAWELVARTDHGIAQPTDLRGKKIGVPRKTIGEFFLGNFLILNQISANDITLVDLPPQDLVRSLSDGSIDATMIFEPYVFNLKRDLGTKAISWPGQSGRPNYIGLFASGSIVRDNPSAVKRFVQSLVQAQEFIEKNPEKLPDFMKNNFHYTEEYVASVLPKFKFYVALEQPMILLMEDEAQWSIDTKLTSQTQIPNYLDFIYSDPLDAIKPEAVTIIR